MKDDDGDMGPGEVLESRLVVHGHAADNPSWTERVTARMLGGIVEGTASFFERLVVSQRTSKKKRAA